MKKTFKEVSKKIYDTYGDNSILPILFGVSSLFKNEIVPICGQFPHLFLNGKFGTGKTSLMRFIKEMLGQTTNTVYDLEKRADLFEKLSRNKLCFFDEYNATPNPKNESLIKAIYDSKSVFIGTNTIGQPKENQLKSSLAVAMIELTNNPTLLNRCVLQELDKQFFSNEENKKFEDCKTFFQNNDCSSNKEILQYSATVNENFESNTPRQSSDDYFNLTTRMTGNYKVLVAVYECLKGHLDFPFTEFEVQKAIVKNHSKHTLLLL